MTKTTDRDEEDRVAFEEKVATAHTALDEAANKCVPCSNLRTAIGYRNDVLCEPLSDFMSGGEQTMIAFAQNGSCTIACVNGEKGTLFTDGRFKPLSSASPSGLGAMSV